MGREYIQSVCAGLILVTCLASNASGQVLHKPETSGENIELFSDRTIYAVSEKLYFTAYYQKPGQIANLDVRKSAYEEKMVWDGNKVVKLEVPVGGADANTGHSSQKSLEWSTVLYVELLKWDGSKLGQTLVPIENGIATGNIQIPANINSGNYFLRAYTRWMRNYSPYLYTYLPVKIVNPFTTAIDNGHKKDKELTDYKLIESEVSHSDQQVISGLRERYGKREAVNLEISLSGADKAGVFSVSVAKSAGPLSGNNSFKIDKVTGFDAATEDEYFPEVNGLSLTGKIVDAATGEPAINKKVYLSSFASSFFLSAVASDENGDFFFTLPHDGSTHELHLAEESDSTGKYEILVASEFCNRPVILPYTAFSLNNEERLIAEEIIRNAQLTEKFKGTGQTLGKQKVGIAYYGTPESVTYVKDYIELKDLREFFFELIQSVTIGYDQRKPSLMISGQSRFGYYPTLVLMDNIPVPNNEELLEIPSRRIERIEVVDKGYVIGNYNYNGIISIFSREKDLAGLELETDSHFFKYQLFDRNDHSFPVYSAIDSYDPTPDRRNLLFWEPAVSLTTDKPAHLQFYTSDAPGRYVITVRSIGENGNLQVIGETVFEVE